MRMRLKEAAALNGTASFREMGRCDYAPAAMEHGEELTACARDKDEEQEKEGGEGKKGVAVRAKCSENVERFCIRHGTYLHHVRKGGVGSSCVRKEFDGGVGAWERRWMQ
jgi:hypothetical protein